MKSCCCWYSFIGKGNLPIEFLPSSCKIVYIIHNILRSFCLFIQLIDDERMICWLLWWKEEKNWFPLLYTQLIRCVAECTYTGYTQHSPQYDPELGRRNAWACNELIKRNLHIFGLGMVIFGIENRKC